MQYKINYNVVENKTKKAYNENSFKTLMINVRGGFMGDNHRSEKTSKTAYVIGSIALTAAAFVVVPKVMEWSASKLYNQKVKQKLKDEDDWGPEIVKTDSLKKEKENAEL